MWERSQVLGSEMRVHTHREWNQLVHCNTNVTHIILDVDISPNCNQQFNYPQVTILNSYIQRSGFILYRVK